MKVCGQSRTRSQKAERVQLTTDGFRPYLNAVEDAFGANVDYAMLVKLYGKDEPEPYVPAQIINSLPIPVTGDPNPRLISTSHSPSISPNVLVSTPCSAEL